MKVAPNSRTLIIEIKFINTSNAVIHTEIFQLSLNWDLNLSWELGFNQNWGSELGFGALFHNLLEH